MTIVAPELLSLPPKLMPLITEFNNYRYFLITGGRGSGKTHGVTRLLLYLASRYPIRVVCGRELKSTVAESVHTVLADHIRDYNLYFDVNKERILHNFTQASFLFKGFREQGSVNVKGLEGIDVLWVDEAQSLTKPTLDVVIPTIRKKNSKRIFTMNRHTIDDAVPAFLEGRDDCLCIELNYLDNPFCTEETADDYLFNFRKLEAAFSVEPIGETAYKQRVLAIDFAAQGNDLCVASVFDRASSQHWELKEQIAWDQPDTTISTGKIINLIGQYNPTVSILDVGGMGHAVWCSLCEAGLDVKRFDGAATKSSEVLVENKLYINARANAYYLTKEWFEQGFIKINERDRECVKQLRKTRMKFRSDGRRAIIPKHEMEKSPDHGDSLVMAVWGAARYLGNANTETQLTHRQDVQRISRSRRSRR